MIKEAFPQSNQNQESKENYFPIRSIIIDKKNIDEKTEKTLIKIIKNGVNVDYEGYETDYEQTKMINRGEQTYVISQCTPEDKYSKNFYDCTSIILIGKSISSKKQLSIMTHQDPSKFLERHKEHFEYDLVRSIDMLKSKTEINSIDAVVLGGHDDLKVYQQSIKRIDEILLYELHSSPTVLTGPDLRGGPTDIFLDTQNRRVYVVRSYQYENTANHHFVPSEVDNKNQMWKKEISHSKW
jgi:hypothetical protein